MSIFKPEKICVHTVANVKVMWETFCRHNLLLSEKLISSTWAVIKARYCEPVRFYHTLEHIEDLIIVLEPYKSGIADLPCIILALFFHDIVYDPKSSLNEEKSAELFVEMFTGKLTADHLDKNLIPKVVSYILATKTHYSENTADRDLNIFLDIDMSILGREHQEYAEYSLKIFKEYSHMEVPIFKEARAKFLRNIIMGDRKIFCTEEFRSTMEDQAMKNLVWEVSEVLEPR